MKLNWTALKERKPQRYDGLNSAYISCLVYACNPEVPSGGVTETCRWDVENERWYESDIRRNWLLQAPYQITHFADDVLGPYETI